MAVLNCLVSKTFMNLELFLQKAAGLDIFEGLIFKYKVKIDLLEPLSIHFLAFLKEFANQLQYVVEESTLQKPDQFEHFSNASSILAVTHSDESYPIKTEIINTHGIDQEVVYVPDRECKPAKDDSNPSVIGSRPKPKQASNTKKVHVKRKSKGRTRKAKLSKNQLEKGKEDLFKTLSSLKVESVFEDAKDSSPIPAERLLPGLGPGARDPFKREAAVVPQGIPDNLPFYCCLTCLEVYKNPETYDGHWCKEGEDGAETSGKTLCSMTTSHLVRQVERLRAMKSFKCGLCREEYRSYDRITYHLPRCGGGPYRCELCHVECRFKRDLNAHKKKAHRREKCFFCDECGVVFLHRTSLQKHQVNRHEQNQTLFACELCHKQFNKRINLTNHNISVHKLEKKFLCQICGNKFFTQGSLQVHLEIHSEPRKFSCAYCSKKFQQKEKLLFHTRIHTGERPHLCQTCGKRFIRKSKLDEHMRRHRGEKRFQCRMCHKCYAGNWDLKIHVKKQHSEAAPVSLPTPTPTKMAAAQPIVKRAKRKPSAKPSRDRDVAPASKPSRKLETAQREPEQSELRFPSTNQTDGEQRIVLMDPLLIPSQTLSLNNEENSSRIIVLNPIQTQNKSEEGSRILVQVSNPQSDLNLDRRVFVQLDQQHQNPGAIYGMLGENLAAQYIHLTESEDGEVITPVVQFPLGGNNVPFAGLQTQAGIVFASTFDLNGLAYIDKTVDDYR